MIWNLNQQNGSEHNPMPWLLSPEHHQHHHHHHHSHDKYDTDIVFKVSEMKVTKTNVSNKAGTEM